LPEGGHALAGRQGNGFHGTVNRRRALRGV